MQRIQFDGGAYSARSVIANSQRRVNYYPEVNRKDALTEYTHYQRPGLLPVAQGIVAPVRGLYRSSTGAGYCVIGANVYSIGADWTLTEIGTITGVGAARTNPVSFSDNGIEILLVDGSAVGWSIILGTNTFAQINDPTGTFQGADRVDTIDTFLLWNMPGTNQFGSTLSLELTFDALYFASKSNYPDLLKTLIVNNHYILLLGDLKSEIWYDAGNAQFPFAELPGAYIEHGIAAKYSVASADLSVFWLAQDLQGVGYVLRQRGYNTERVSNHAIEFAIEQWTEAGGSVADAIGYCHQQNGHLFYVLTFPGADMTWVYDDSIPDHTAAWHQRAWTDANGVLHRDRTNCAAFINGINVVGDWENGTIYQLSTNTYTDTVNGAVGPITCIASFPHIDTAPSQPQVGFTLPIQSNLRRMQFNAVYLDMEVGTVPGTLANVFPPQVSLSVSIDRGKTFQPARLQSAGSEGQFLTEPTWRAQGLSRDMIFEISHSLAGPAALNGICVDAVVLPT